MHSTRAVGFSRPARLDIGFVVKYSFVTMRQTWIGESIIPQNPLAYAMTTVERSVPVSGSAPRSRTTTGKLAPMYPTVIPFVSPLTKGMKTTRARKGIP